MISIAILGAGNVATHLFKAFNKAKNVNINQWYNRNIETIAPYKNDVDIIDDVTLLKEADVYIIAVSDDAVSNLAEQMPFENRLVVHTSGSVSVYDINKKQKRGVFYPLQTFSKDAEIDFANVPICIETIDNTQIAKDLKQVRASVVKGKSITEPLGRIKYFPPLVNQMVKVGESTGNLDTMLVKVADVFEDETEDAIKTMTSLIEPIILVGLGGLIGTVLIAMYLPIFMSAGGA